jgi:hypothetical protein
MESWIFLTFHINTLTAIYAPHMSVHMSQGGTHMAHLYRVIPYLPQSTQPSTFSAFDFQPRCLLPDGCEPQGPRSLCGTPTDGLPAGGGAVTTMQGGIGLTETSGMIRLSQKFGQDGPYTVRYSSCTCFFFFCLRQNCRIKGSPSIYAPSISLSHLKKKLPSIRHY